MYVYIYSHKIRSMHIIYMYHIYIKYTYILNQLHYVSRLVMHIIKYSISTLFKSFSSLIELINRCNNLTSLYSSCTGIERVSGLSVRPSVRLSAASVQHLALPPVSSRRRLLAYRRPPGAEGPGPPDARTASRSEPPSGRARRQCPGTRRGVACTGRPRRQRHAVRKLRARSMHFNVCADAKAEAHTRIGADARLLELRGDVTRDKVPVARGKLHVLPRRSKPLLIRLFPSRMRSRLPDDDIGHVQKVEPQYPPFRSHSPGYFPLLFLTPHTVG